MIAFEATLIELAVSKLSAALNSITPEQEQAAADLINKKIGGNEPLELAVIKGAVTTAQAIASVLPQILKL